MFSNGFVFSFLLVIVQVMIRKTFSYVFLCLILLNTTGYYGLFIGWKYKHESGVQARLDTEHYRPRELHTVKIPIAIPYVFDSPGFSRINGTFQHQGTFYRLVKQRLSSDTLILVCIRDDETRKIHDVFGAVVHIFSGQGDSHSPAPGASLSFIKEYIATAILLQEYTSGWVMNLHRYICCENLVSSFTSSIEQPPRG